MKKTNKIALVVVLFLVVVFGVGQFFASSNLSSVTSNGSSTAGGGPSTQVTYYTPPPLASGAPTVAGSCWTNSIAAPYRADAWRCAVGNGIQDPCFQIGGSTSTLLCGIDPTNPMSTLTFALKLTAPLPPADTVPTSTAPNVAAWLVELQDGTLCTPFTVASQPVMDGQATANYDCAPGQLGTDVVIFGNLNSGTSLWTADVGSLSTSSKIFPPIIVSSSSVPIAAVWE